MHHVPLLPTHLPGGKEGGGKEGRGGRGGGKEERGRGGEEGVRLIVEHMKELLLHLLQT